MESDELVQTLNALPMRIDYSDQHVRSTVEDTVSKLLEMARFMNTQQRRELSATLSRPARYAMAQYSRDKAVQARRTGSGTAVLYGVAAVALAAGETTNTPTGGSLLSLLLHSALRCGLDASELFIQAAGSASSESVADEIRRFPELSAEQRDLARWGFCEKRTSRGVMYEHAAEASLRPRWWERLLGRRPLSKRDIQNELRQMDQENRSRATE